MDYEGRRPALKAAATTINTASVNAYDPGENIIDDAAPKGAIMICTKSLARQLAKEYATGQV